MSTVTNPLGSPARATIADLLKVEGKAELIDGRVVQFMPTAVPAEPRGVPDRPISG